MQAKSVFRVVIVGSGHLATHLAFAIQESNNCLVQILSRDVEKAKALVRTDSCEAISQVSQIDSTVDFIILALKDDVLNTDYIAGLPQGPIICHTSGSVPMGVLSDYPKQGVFYPLQTFSKQKKVDFQQIPLCLEANTEEVSQMLHQFASSLSSKVYQVNSAQRETLHIAAVYACNFTNLMYDMADDLCKESDLSFDLLRPLIIETAQKVQDHLPSEVQTGPASRRDLKTINKHINILSQHADYQDIYRILSDEILKKNEEL